MNIRLLVNLTTHESSLTAYYFDQMTKKFDILDIVKFDTKNMISNSAITDQIALKNVVENSYNQIIERNMIQKFESSDLILPFQVPVLNTPIYEKKKIVGYQKTFDESQFRLISHYKITFKDKITPYSYFVNKSLLEKYLEILKQININAKSVYTPALIVSHCFSNKTKYNVVIELDDKRITFNFYYGQKIFYSKSIIMGIDVLFNRIKEICEKNYDFNKQFQIDQVRKLIRNKMILNCEKPLPLMVFYGEKPGYITNLLTKDIKDVLAPIVIKLFSKTLNDFLKELQIDELESVVIYKNEFVYWLFAEELQKSNFSWNALSNLTTRFTEWKCDPTIECFLLKKLQKVIQNQKRKNQSNATTISTNLKNQFVVSSL